MMPLSILFTRNQNGQKFDGKKLDLSWLSFMVNENSHICFISTVSNLAESSTELLSRGSKQG